MTDEAKAIAETSKTAGLLVTKVSDAIGGALKPWHLKRVARAEVEADTIKALGALAISDIQRRALRRVVVEEAYKQKNLEDIVRESIKLLDDKSKPDEISEDWMVNFVDKAKLVSDADARQFWAQILAGEANAPGRFSKRTVNALASLDKDDAELFAKLCNFCWNISGPQPLIFDVESEIYNKNGVYFSTITHLQSIGLLNFLPLEGYRRKEVPDKFVLEYQRRFLALEFVGETKHNLALGHVMLTRVGQELAGIISLQPIDGLFQFVMDYYKKHNIKAYDPEQEVTPASPQPQKLLDNSDQTN